MCVYLRSGSVVLAGLYLQRGEGRSNWFRNLLVHGHGWSWSVTRQHPSGMYISWDTFECKTSGWNTSFVPRNTFTLERIFSWAFSTGLCFSLCDFRSAERAKLGRDAASLSALCCAMWDYSHDAGINYSTSSQWTYRLFDLWLKWNLDKAFLRAPRTRSESSGRFHIPLLIGGAVL